jgi:hypothetical protein
MKLVALFLSFCLSLNVVAASSPTQALEQAFDNYHYALTVEWNQEDATFKENQTNIFFAQIDSLFAQGLTSEEISNFVEKKVSDQKLLSNIKTNMNKLAMEAGSTADLAALLNANSADFYQQGASWTASRAQVAGIVVAISALFLYGIFFNIKYGCLQTIDGVDSYCTDDPSYNQF